MISSCTSPSARRAARRSRPKLARADAVQRRQPALQHVVQAAIAGGLFDRQAVGRRFHRAQQVRVARGAGAGRADLGFAEIAAALAMADLFDRLGQRVRQPLAARALALQHVVGHALRGLRADARQHAERFDQLFEQRGDVMDSATSQCRRSDQNRSAAARGGQASRTRSAASGRPEPGPTIKSPASSCPAGSACRRWRRPSSPAIRCWPC